METLILLSDTKRTMDRLTIFVFVDGTASLKQTRLLTPLAAPFAVALLTSVRTTFRCFFQKEEPRCSVKIFDWATDPEEAVGLDDRVITYDHCLAWAEEFRQHVVFRTATTSTSESAASSTCVLTAPHAAWSFLSNAVLSRRTCSKGEAYPVPDSPLVQLIIVEMLWPLLVHACQSPLQDPLTNCFVPMRHMDWKKQAAGFWLNTPPNGAVDVTRYLRTQHVGVRPLGVMIFQALLNYDIYVGVMETTVQDSAALHQSPTVIWQWAKFSNFGETMSLLNQIKTIWVPAVRLLQCAFDDPRLPPEVASLPPSYRIVASGSTGTGCFVTTDHFVNPGKALPATTNDDEKWFQTVTHVIDSAPTAGRKWKFVSGNCAVGVKGAFGSNDSIPETCWTVTLHGVPNGKSTWAVLERWDLVSSSHDTRTVQRSDVSLLRLRRKSGVAPSSVPPRRLDNLFPKYFGSMSWLLLPALYNMKDGTSSRTLQIEDSRAGRKLLTISQLELSSLKFAKFPTNLASSTTYIDFVKALYDDPQWFATTYEANRAHLSNFATDNWISDVVLLSHFPRESQRHPTAAEVLCSLDVVDEACHLVPTVPGSSGSAIWQHVRPGTWACLGVHVRGAAYLETASTPWPRNTSHDWISEAKPFFS